MQFSRRKVLFGAAFLSAAAAAGVVARNVTRPSCRNPHRWRAMEMSKARGCFEYWFNRYQALIAAVIGSSVAIWLVRPVLRQANLLDRQVAVSFKLIAEERAAANAKQLKDIEQLRAGLPFIDAFIQNRRGHLAPMTNGMTVAAAFDDRFRWIRALRSTFDKGREAILGDEKNLPYRQELSGSFVGFLAHIEQVVTLRWQEERSGDKDAVPHEPTAAEAAAYDAVRTRLVGAMNALEPRLRARELADKQTIERAIERSLAEY